MVLGLFDQLQIFRLLYLIELVGFLSGLGLLELQHLIYPRLLAGFGMLVVLTNLSFIEFQVRYLAFFYLFTVIDTFRLFWMGSLQDNIQLMLEFLKASVLVRHFSYTFPTLMIFLMMLFSEQDTVDWGKKWLVDFNDGKTQLFSCDSSDNTDVKMDGSTLEGKSSFKILGLTFSSKLDWDSYIISLLKLCPRKLNP